MKVLIVSDSHNHNEILDDLIRRYKDVELFLHAGDSEVPAYTVYPFRTVKGNCDYYFDMLKELIIPSPFGNILVRHKEDATYKYLKDNNVMIYVYGHTHVKACKKKNGICYLNPGSLVYPRDTEASYAILENEEKECFCTFYNLDTHEKIKKYRIYLRDPSIPLPEVPSEEEEEYNYLDYTKQEVEDAFNKIKEELKKENKD